MERAVVTSSHVCCCFLLRERTPHTPPLLQHGTPPTGDSPLWTSQMGVLPMGCSSQTAPVWVSSHGVSPSGTTCSSKGLPWGDKSYQGACSSLCKTTGTDRSLLQHRSPIGSQPSWGILLLQCDVLHGYSWIWTSPWASMAAEAQLPHCGLPHRLQGNICLSFSTDLGICRVISLLYSHSSPLAAVALPCFFIFNTLSQRCYHCCW